MPTRNLRWVVAAPLLAMSLSASAASVLAEAFVITQSGVETGADVVLNSPLCALGATSTVQVECLRLQSFVGLGAPPTDTGTITKLRSVFDAGNGSAVPNFVMNGHSRAFASLGQLHADTFVQIQGAGGNNVTIGGSAYVQVTDKVTVKSSTLPNGATVTVKVKMDVSGQGGGRMYFGIGSNLQRVDSANDFPVGGDALQDYETSFSATVGQSLNVNYGLLAYARMFSSGWGPINVLNGRSNSASYGNSAYVYLWGLDPAQGITLQSDTGFLYTAPVPAPAAAWLLLAGLSVVGWRVRRLGRG